MSDIDKQRIAAVAMLKSLGLTWDEELGAWVDDHPRDPDPSGPVSTLLEAADELYGYMDAYLQGGRPAEHHVSDAVEAYVRYRTVLQPKGKVPGGKG
jgi:hypothetical protein